MLTICQTSTIENFCEEDVTSHLFEPPWINDQGREVQTTLCDLLSRSFVGSQGGRQLFTGGQAHPGRKVFKGIWSEALCKESVWRLKEEGDVLSFTVQISISVIWSPKYF